MFRFYLILAPSLVHAGGSYVVEVNILHPPARSDLQGRLDAVTVMATLLRGDNMLVTGRENIVPGYQGTIRIKVREEG